MITHQSFPPDGENQLPYCPPAGSRKIIQDLCSASIIHLSLQNLRQNLEHLHNPFRRWMALAYHATVIRHTLFSPELDATAGGPKSLAMDAVPAKTLLQLQSELLLPTFSFPSATRESFVMLDEMIGSRRDLTFLISPSKERAKSTPPPPSLAPNAFQWMQVQVIKQNKLKLSSVSYLNLHLAQRAPGSPNFLSATHRQASTYLCSCAGQQEVWI